MLSDSSPLTAPEADLSAVQQLRQAVAEVEAVVERLSETTGDRVLSIVLQGYRGRLRAISEETAQILEWVHPERPKLPPPPIAPKAPVADPAMVRRARLAQKRFKDRQRVADLRAQMQANQDAGFPTDASQRELDRLRENRVREFGEDNYVFGLASTHQLTAAEWQSLASIYGVLAAEAGTWTRKPSISVDDADRISRLIERFEAAIVPCGADLDHDIDVRWLKTLQPPPLEPEGPAPDDLATMETFLQAIRSTGVNVPSPTIVVAQEAGPGPADRCRLKADVARTKARIERAESRGKRDDAASYDLSRLQTRHRLEFHEEFFVFGFAKAHRLDVEAWDRLAQGYEALAEAWDAGIESEDLARRAIATVEALRETIRPVGRMLRRDDDADDLEAEVANRYPSLMVEAVEDPLAPFVDRLQALGDDLEAAATVAEEAILAGARPSDPRLREPLLEWADDLADLNRGTLEPLIRELRLELARREQADREEEEALVPDEEYLQLRERVRALTRGARMLMVGGSNREDVRRRIQQELDLAELEWNDSDEHKTKPADFDRAVDRADIVVKNRFCRRGYQRALERAKEQGKPAIALTGGYNPRQVVRTIADARRL